MLIVSYDIQDDRLRSQFNKMLCKNGCVRLQYSVYEMNNTQRIIDNLILKINEFGLKFEGGDSVIIYEVSSIKVKKYGNAIHRDADIVYL